MKQFYIIEAPSTLGLTSKGVELLPHALRDAGLMNDLQADNAVRIDVPASEKERDTITLLLNPHSIREYTQLLADRVARVIKDGYFPVVLGGDCSILIGCMLALKRLGKYGLFFIDGHADFYQPEAEPNGEVASMELAIITGRGPDILSDIDGLKPLVKDENIIAFGCRDMADQKQYGSQDIAETSINTFNLDKVQEAGCSVSIRQALQILQKRDLDGFWIHCDADVLNDAIMPAVDYRMPGGLQWNELTDLLSELIKTGNAAGITITIFNPTLDPEGIIAKKFSRCIADGLRGR